MDLKVKVTWRFFLVLTLSILFLPLKLLIAWIIASFVHELFHLLAMFIFRSKIYGIKLDGTGIQLLGGTTDKFKKIICSIAGPLGSISLITVIKHFPLLGTIGLIQGVYNCLPFFPLDGWHILSLITRNNIKIYIKCFCSIVLVIIGTYLLFRAWGILPLLLSFLVIFRDWKNTLQLRC